MGYIPQHSLENLKKYSYKGVDKSLLSRYVLNPFWNRFVTLWPLWVAPNTITLLGLSILLGNLATLVYYDPMYLTEKNGAEGPPNWVYFSWGIGLFVYQTFDAIDGKQARRTGMAGPLGEMFDHGCDALNTTIGVILVSRTLNLGRSWWTVCSQVATLANFYLSTWEEYHTGTLFLSYFSGPVEGIIIIVVIYLVTGFTGPAFWDNGILSTTHLDRIPFFARLPDFPMNEAFMVFGAIGLWLNALTAYLNVRRARQSTHKSSVSPLLLLLPFIFPSAIQILWLLHPRYNNSWILDSPAFLPFLCAWGLQFAHQVGRMILAHVTSTPFPVWDWVWIWSFLGAVDANLPKIGFTPLVQKSPKHTLIFVWVTLAISFLAYARFVTLVIRDITNYLGIACFTVRKRDEKGLWKNAQPDSKVL